MSTVVELQNELNNCRQRLSDLEGQLRTSERNYESLCNFKRALQTSQGEFEAVNSGGMNAFSEIESIKKDCRTAREYQEGMTLVLNGVGAKMVGGLYSAMEVSASIKLQKYIYEISRCDEKISKCRMQIDTLERKIAQAEKEPPVIRM